MNAFSRRRETKHYSQWKGEVRPCLQSALTYSIFWSSETHVNSAGWSYYSHITYHIYKSSHQVSFRKLVLLTDLGWKPDKISLLLPPPAEKVNVISKYCILFWALYAWDPHHILPRQSQQHTFLGSSFHSLEMQELCLSTVSVHLMQGEQFLKLSCRRTLWTVAIAFGLVRELIPGGTAGLVLLWVEQYLW